MSVVVFACVFGIAAIGMFLRGALPQHHLSDDSKDAVKLAMGLVATMSALVLGLFVSSAKGFYDTQSAEVTQMSATFVMLDHALAHYGPETKEARDLLRNAVVGTLDSIWPSERTRASEGIPAPETGELFDKIQALSPKDDEQRSLQAQAVSMAIGLGHTRWLMFAQGAASLSNAMLAILVFWLTTLFFSFGIFAPRNTTVIAALFASGLSVSGAVFLIMEMYKPYAGLIGVSSAPLRSALMHLGH
jgi:Protein of unknown function (DUF4239)